MVFKRRDQRPWLQIVAEVLWPRGGWSRAFQYVQHRLRRLPGTPEQIARGIFAGVLVSFSPFFGLHFILAGIIAKIMRGSILASLLATFIGNPLTYVPIAVISLQTGHFLLGSSPRSEVDESVFAKFGGAAGDLWHNFIAIFTPERAHWDELAVFGRDVFWPWLVGGIIPGTLCGLLCYYLSVPVIRAYQKRRAAKLRKKMDKLERQAKAAD
ncbi:DUF2062 domain-containing protein [Roseicyclus sp.]|uniref:DUF2062 domain-containing protein n=1 Tax=Roseicyclus sp. TaxID=1914329 RepID=UPI003F9FEC2E